MPELQRYKYNILKNCKTTLWFSRQKYILLIFLPRESSQICNSQNWNTFVEIIFVLSEIDQNDLGPVLADILTD